MTSADVLCYVGLGANLGDAKTNVQRAIVALGSLPTTRLRAQSSLFRTAPIAAIGNDYVNAVAAIDTKLSAAALLEHLQLLETDFGRTRSFTNAPRLLDLDLLLYGQQTIANTALTVPHPRLTERAFTLIPLLQLDPLITIPGAGPAHQFVPAVANQIIQKII